MVACLEDRHGRVPLPYAGGATQAEWTAADGRVWVPADCIVCGHRTEVPLSWVRAKLAAVWEPDAQRVIRHVLT